MAKRPTVAAGPVPASNPRPAITGGFAVPAGAPYEIAQPLQADAGGIVTADGQLITPAMLAAQNERQLAPLSYPVGQQVTTTLAPPIVSGSPAAPAPVGHRPAAPRGVQPAPVVQGVRPPRPPVQAAPAANVVQPARPVLAAGGVGAQLASAVRSIGSQAQQARDHQPAASNSDSPSRGIPRASGDPNKAITGGFGDAGAAEYFPLDGSEVLKVVWVLMDEIAKRLTNDLRFSPAIVYPRVAVRCAVTVEGYAEDQTFVVERAAKPHDRTPLELAQALSDEVIFVVLAERREFDKSGQSQTPANAMRAEVGATPPRKQVVGAGNNRQIVDIV